ncbi:hypothetical protein MASR1M101_22910 [Gemmatimonas sp.]
MRGWYYTNPRDEVAREIGASRKALAAEGRWMLIRIRAHTPALRRGSVAGGSGYVAVMEANFRPDA